MSTRDYAAERYNRRTRAIERQAAAADRIADALAVIAVAATAQTSSATTDGRARMWTDSRASELMKDLSRRANLL